METSTGRPAGDRPGPLPSALDHALRRRPGDPRGDRRRRRRARLRMLRTRRQLRLRGRALRRVDGVRRAHPLASAQGERRRRRHPRRRLQLSYADRTERKWRSPCHPSGRTAGQRPSHCRRPTIPRAALGATAGHPIIIERTIAMKTTSEALGHTRWVIAEGWIPPESNGPHPEMPSHETACILNAGPAEAHVAITVFFADRDPVGPYTITVPARRTLHQRFNDLCDPAPIPRGTDYASVIESDVPVVVQHTRLDSRQAANALLTTVAFPA